MKCDESKRVTLYCSLSWFNCFVGFFRQDYQTQLALGDSEVGPLMRSMYKDLFPDMITTIMRLKADPLRIDAKCYKLVEMINDAFLQAVISIIDSKADFEYIFARLKKEFFSEHSRSAETQETIIQWYTELFKEFDEELFDSHSDIFEGLISNLNFEKSELVKRIMYLVCMLSKQNEKYSRLVMEQLIARFYEIRS